MVFSKPETIRRGPLMPYTIRRGKIDDIPEIMKIVGKTVAIMKSEDIDQWTEEYPLASHFTADAENETLYVAEGENGEVAGSITIDRNEPEEYSSPEWRKDKPALLFHRLVVDPEVRGKGIASLLIEQAEKMSKEHKLFYIRTDTYSLNKKAQSLFIKNGFKQTGTIQFMGKDNPFYTYDKLVKEE
jgi:ribosomal protein S18 acetylase RimI-like enzyme